MGERYKLNMGKFGAYFYDRGDDRDLTLDDVLKLLNEHEVYKKKDEEGASDE